MTDDPLTIRPVRMDDAQVLIDAARASREALAPWAAPPMDTERFEHWLDAHATPRSCVRVAFLGDRTVVGCVTISEIVRGSFESAYLAYWGHASTAGRGLMTRVVAGVIAEAFGPLALHRLEANIQPDNARSIALVRRLGFIREGYSARYLKIGGEWRDHERWAIRSDMDVWRKRDA